MITKVKRKQPDCSPLLEIFKQDRNEWDELLLCKRKTDVNPAMTRIFICSITYLHMEIKCISKPDTNTSRPALIII